MKILFGLIPGVIIMYVTGILKKKKRLKSSGKTPLCHAQGCHRTRTCQSRLFDPSPCLHTGEADGGGQGSRSDQSFINSTLRGLDCKWREKVRRI